MGNYNLPDEDSAHFSAISGQTYSESSNFLTADNFSQLVTEPIDKDGKVLNLSVTKYDNPEILCIEKHLVFSDHFSISLGIPISFSSLSNEYDFKSYSLSVSDIQSIDIELSTSLFSFHLLQVSDNLVDEWLKTFETILNTFLN